MAAMRSVMIRISLVPRVGRKREAYIMGMGGHDTSFGRNRRPGWAAVPRSGMREGGLLHANSLFSSAKFSPSRSEPGHVNVKGRVKNGHEGVRWDEPTVRNPYRTLSILSREGHLEAQGTGGRRAFRRLQRRGVIFGR